MRVMYKILDSRAFEEFCCVSTPDDVPDVDTIGRFRNLLIKHEKNKEKKRDPEAHSAKKGNMWHFGYKAHIGVDSNSGLVHHIETMPANEHVAIIMRAETREPRMPPIAQPIVIVSQ